MPALTMKALRARFDDDVRHAEATLLQDGYLAPMFAVTTRDERVLPVMADFGSPEAKQACITAVRLLCIAEDAAMAVYMAEAWLVVGDLAPGVSPGQSDRRVEAVLVSVNGRIGQDVKHLSSVREILRGADGRPTGLRSLSLPGMKKGSQVDLGGPMSELLPPRLPTREQRLVAASCTGPGYPGASRGGCLCAEQGHGRAMAACGRDPRPQGRVAHAGPQVRRR